MMKKVRFCGGNCSKPFVGEVGKSCQRHLALRYIAKLKPVAIGLTTFLLAMVKETQEWRGASASPFFHQHSQ